MSQGNSLYSYFKQTKTLFFYKNGEQEQNRSSPGEVVPVGVEGMWGKGVGG
jgi:hypothetical protein